MNVSIGRPVAASVTMPRMRSGLADDELEDGCLLRWFDRQLRHTIPFLGGGQRDPVARGGVPDESTLRIRP